MRYPGIIHKLRHIGYGFIVLICAYWFLDNYFGGTVNWFILTLGVLSLAQLFIEVKILDLVLGYMLIILCAYMNLAVLSDLAKWHEGKPCRDPGIYFGMGFTIFGLALLLSICICASYYVPKKTKPA